MEVYRELSHDTSSAQLAVLTPTPLQRYLEGRQDEAAQDPGKPEDYFE